MSRSFDPPASSSMPNAGAATPPSASPSPAAGAMPLVSPPQPTLRHATQDDRQAMLAVMAPFQNAFFPGKLDTRSTLVAEISGAIVGFIGWKGNHILALYVAEAWRKTRIVGPALLKAAEKAVQAGNHRTVRLMIDADATDAHRFYMKRDYETKWDRDNADVAWMIKKFT